MGDINRNGGGSTFHNVHLHYCPNCHRRYSCNCQRQSDQSDLVCRDCETATYDPRIHGGTGERSEA